MKILAVIPARSGSKSVKDKNIRQFNGKPMLAHSIAHARESKYINRIIVSTDSEQYAQIANAYGAETPFLRPKEISGDFSLDIEVFEHALSFLEEQEGYIPDIVVQLRPTYPIRDASDIDNMIKLLIDNDDADSVRCIAPAREIAHKMWYYNEEGYITPIMKDIPEAYNMPRQVLPKVYYQNACIDAIRANVITGQHSMSGTKIMGYQMKHNFDIDTEEEFQAAESFSKLESGNQTFVFDIDGVVAQFREDLEYKSALPNQNIIDVINYLYEHNNYIVLFTARGYKTGIDWLAVTAGQMRQWGVKYHELKFGKPSADFYIDDKMLSLDTLYRFSELLHITGNKAGCHNADCGQPGK